MKSTVIALPYYEVKTSNPKYSIIYGEAFLIEKVTPIRRFALVTPTRVNLAPAPGPHSKHLNPISREQYLDMLRQTLREILSIEWKPGFEWGGIKNIFKSIVIGVSLGFKRAKGPQATPNLEKSLAYEYVTEILGFTSPNEIVTVGNLYWKTLKVNYEIVEEEADLKIHSVEKYDWENKEWEEDPVITKILATEYPCRRKLYDELTNISYF